MARLSIRVRFPLGTYLGHRDVGLRSPFPDTARLHAALVHAAGKGSTAIEVDGELTLSPDSIAALKWLEENPPAAVSHPATVETSALSAESWRAEGVWGPGGQKKARKPQSDAMAVGDCFGWIWEEDVSHDLASTIDTLCADVSCLGEADSPAVLDLVELPATHRRDDVETAFPEPGGLAIRTPLEGRLDELETAHRTARPRKPPTRARDRWRTNEDAVAAAPTSTRVRDTVYRPVVPPPPDAPWTLAVLLRLDRQIPVHHRIAVAVAAHRAAVSRLGDNAPSVITGKYERDVRPPANRIAIQYLDAELVHQHDIDTNVIAVLLPKGADVVELAALERALDGLSRIYFGSGEVRVVSRTQVSTETFWPAPAPRTVRRWRPLPSLVPETRRQRKQAGQRWWTLDDAALLSVAHVFRDELAEDARGSRNRMVDAIRARGVRAYEIRTLPDPKVEHHVHKMPAGVTVQPYTALLDLSPMVGDRTLLTLGQSRHLGGGLLVPEDVPNPIAQARGLV